MEIAIGDALWIGIIIFLGWCGLEVLKGIEYLGRTKNEKSNSK